MGTRLKYMVVISIILLVTEGCYSPHEVITIWNKKYDVYKDDEYLDEQNLLTTFNTVCFHKTKLVAFAYQSAGKRNDSNFVNSELKVQNDTLIIITRFDKSVYGYPRQFIRYYQFHDEGLISLNSNNLITPKYSRKNNMRYRSTKTRIQ
ncbi:MAG: hypothetical protein RI983_2179 [Bacteroidota bacterium]|jgi:hypothetical protein